MDYNYKTKIKDSHTLFSDFVHPFSEELILWLELTYDRDSPLALQYPDIAVRRLVAAADAGLNADDEEIAAMIQLEDAEMLALVHYYLTVVLNNNTWNLLVTNQMVFDEYTRVARAPLDVDTDDKMIKATQVKTVLLRDCDTISKRIEGYIAEIFASEMAKEKGEGERQLRITVEGQAANIRETKRKQQQQQQQPLE